MAARAGSRRGAAKRGSDQPASAQGETSWCCHGANFHTASPGQHLPRQAPRERPGSGRCGVRASGRGASAGGCRASLCPLRLGPSVGPTARAGATTASYDVQSLALAFRPGGPWLPRTGRSSSSVQFASTGPEPNRGPLTSTDRARVGSRSTCTFPRGPTDPLSFPRAPGAGSAPTAAGARGGWPASTARMDAAHALPHAGRPRLCVVLYRPRGRGILTFFPPRSPARRRSVDRFLCHLPLHGPGHDPSRRQHRDSRPVASPRWPQELPALEFNGSMRLRAGDTGPVEDRGCSRHIRGDDELWRGPPTRRSRSTTRARSPAARSLRCPAAVELFAPPAGPPASRCACPPASPRPLGRDLDALAWHSLVDLCLLSPGRRRRGRPPARTCLLEPRCSPDGGDRVASLAVVVDTPADVRGAAGAPARSCRVAFCRAGTQRASDRRGRRPAATGAGQAPADAVESVPRPASRTFALFAHVKGRVAGAQRQPAA